MQGITKELETSMSMKERLSYSIMPDITPKIDDETAFSLRSRDYIIKQLNTIIKYIHQKGYEIVTLDEITVLSPFLKTNC